MNKELNSNSFIRVLVADPYPVVREGLAAMIAREPDMECIGFAATGQEAVSRFAELRPDVLVTEHFLDEDGQSVLRHLRAEFPSACVLVLTLQAGDEAIYQALHCGAKGYYFKDAPVEAIADAIRMVCKGQNTLPQHVAAMLAARLHTMDLTHRERQVLLHMALGKSNQEIGNALFISEGTVKAHANNIFVKLNVCDRTQAVILAFKRGLVPPP